MRFSFGNFTNSGGQVSWTDGYFNFTGLTYSQAVLPDSGGAPIDIGSQATFGNNWVGQFYRTSLLYDDRGRQDETIEPTGTIDSPGKRVGCRKDILS